ncbi:MAG: hypothetical protein ACRDJN_24215 [Chloroflexota bacterium]
MSPAFGSRPVTRRRFVRRSAIGVGLALASAAVGTAGCNVAGQAPAPEPAGGGGRVEFWQIYRNSPAVPQVKELIDQKHPKLQVEFVDVPGGQTPQNVVEWIKVSPLVTFPAGSSGTINPLASTILNEAIDGQRSVKDAASAMAREINAILQRTGT